MFPYSLLTLLTLNLKPWTLNLPKGSGDRDGFAPGDGSGLAEGRREGSAVCEGSGGSGLQERCDQMADAGSEGLADGPVAETHAEPDVYGPGNGEGEDAAVGADLSDGEHTQPGQEHAASSRATEQASELGSDANGGEGLKQSTLKAWLQ